MAACLERKTTLTGKIHEFQCELLHLEQDFGVLKYIIDRQYTIAGTVLRPFDVTYALYWTDRPYTLYIWLTRGRSSYYFNIADSVFLSPDLFSWRDLAVDILIDSDGILHILDEDEVPGDISRDLASRIVSAKELVLSSWQAVIRQADTVVRELTRSGR